MIAEYKILLSGGFRGWGKRDECVKSLTEQLGGSREKAEALFAVERKLTLKKSLSDSEVDRHMAAFEKLGMVVTKRLMLKPFVGPCIERESRMDSMDMAGQQGRGRDSAGENAPNPELEDIRQNKKSWSGLTGKLKSIVGKVSG